MKAQLAALKKKNKGTGGTLHLMGLRNVADLVELEDEDETPPLPPKTPSRSLFTNLLGEARTGGRDILSPEKIKEDRQKKEEYESAHRQPGQVSMSVRETGLPNLQTLQSLGDALKDGTAFRKVSTYRPKDPYPEKPLHKRPQLEDNFYPPKSSQRVKNSCQVGFCDHQDLCIEWDPQDPDNDKGSWKLRMKDYFDFPSYYEEHKSCRAPDPRQKAKILAERIIEKFVKLENEKLTTRDRRSGKEPRRPPPTNRVEREIQNMISQMSRGKHEKAVENREAARVMMDAQDRKKELESKTIQQAQQERQRGEAAKGLDIDDLEDIEELVAKPKKLKKSNIKSGAKSTQQDENRRPKAEPEKRYTSSTLHERDEQLAHVAGQVRQDRAAPSSRLAGNEKTMAAPKRTKTPKAQTPESKLAKVTQDASKKRTSKQPVPDRSIWGQDSEEEEEEKAEQANPTQARKVVSKQQEVPKTATKSEPRKMTAEERALLAGINQAEEEEAAQNVTNSEAEPTSSEEDEEEEELRNELAAIARASIIRDVNPPIQTPTAKLATPKTEVNDERNKEVEESWDFFETARAEEQGQQQAESEEERETSTPKDDEVTNAIEEVVESPPSPKPVKTPVIENDTDELSDAPPTRPSSTHKPASRKRKAPAVENDTVEEQPQKKNSRKPKKSAAIVKDSDDEADYALPVAATKLPEAMVNHGWQAEGAALVEEVVHHQEEVEEQKKAEAEKEDVVTKTTEIQEAVEITETITVTEIVTTTQINKTELSTEDTQTPPSPSQKRKRNTTPEEQDTDEQPTKKPKHSSTEEVARPSTPTPSSTPEPTATPPPAQTPESPVLPHTSTQPPSPTLTPSPRPKRRNPFSDSADDESSSGTESTTSRPVKKAKKKVRFSPEVTSPVAQARKMSIPFIVDEEVEREDEGGNGMTEEELDDLFNE